MTIPGARDQEDRMAMAVTQERLVEVEADESVVADRRAVGEEKTFRRYDPRLMVKLLIYGYANAVMSSRKLERATFRDVAVRMLCADQHPDYRSNARFRKRHLEALG